MCSFFKYVSFLSCLLLLSLLTLLSQHCFSTECIVHLVCVLLLFINFDAQTFGKYKFWNIIAVETFNDSRCQTINNKIVFRKRCWHWKLATKNSCDSLIDHVQYLVSITIYRQNSVFSAQYSVFTLLGCAIKIFNFNFAIFCCSRVDYIWCSVTYWIGS